MAMPQRPQDLDTAEQAAPVQACANCACYAGSRIDPAAAAAARAFVDTNGSCRRYPTPVRKAHHEWCGEWRAPA
jgi:hypothetical protein